MHITISPPLNTLHHQRFLNINTMHPPLKMANAMKHQKEDKKLEKLRIRNHNRVLIKCALIFSTPTGLLQTHDVLMFL